MVCRLASIKLLSTYISMQFESKFNNLQRRKLIWKFFCKMAHVFVGLNELIEYHSYFGAVYRLGYMVSTKWYTWDTMLKWHLCKSRLKYVIKQLCRIYGMWFSSFQLCFFLNTDYWISLTGTWRTWMELKKEAIFSIALLIGYSGLMIELLMQNLLVCTSWYICTSSINWFGTIKPLVPQALRVSI